MKRLAAAACALCLLAAASSYCAAADDPLAISAAETMEDPSYAAGLSSAAAESVAESASTPERPSIEIGGIVIDAAKVEKYLKAIRNVLDSEEFQRLISYEEVRDLAVTIVEYGAIFVRDEPDLSEKVLSELGIEPKYGKIILQAINATADAGSELINYSNSEEGQILMERVKLLLEDPAIEQECKEINELLRGVIK